jgi:hypothetical protein
MAKIIDTALMHKQNCKPTCCHLSRLSDDSANDRFCRSIGIPCQTLSVRFAREKQIKPMTLLLSESETQDLLSMDECIAALGEAYRDLASGEAQNVPRGRIRFAAKDKGEAAYFLTVSRVAAVVWGSASFASTPNRVMSTNSLNARKGFYSSP